MYINNMNNRIKVHEEVLEPNDYLGYESKGETLVCELWAEVSTPNYKELISTGADTASIGLVVNIRKNKAIKRGMTLEIDGERYDVNHVDQTNKELTRLIVQGREVGFSRG